MLLDKLECISVLQYIIGFWFKKKQKNIQKPKSGRKTVAFRAEARRKHPFSLQAVKTPQLDILQRQS